MTNKYSAERLNDGTETGAGYRNAYSLLIKIKYSYSYSLPTDMHVKNLCKKTRKRLQLRVKMMRLQYMEGIKRETLTVNQQINKSAFFFSDCVMYRNYQIKKKGEKE